MYTEVYTKACRDAAQRMASSAQSRMYYNPPLENPKGLELPRKYFSGEFSEIYCVNKKAERLA